MCLYKVVALYIFFNFIKMFSVLFALTINNLNVIIKTVSTYLESIKLPGICCIAMFFIRPINCPVLRQEIDPLGVRKLEMLSGSARKQLLREILAQEGVL